MISRRACNPKRLRLRTFLILLTIIILLWLGLPYDHPIRLAVQFHINNAVRAWQVQIFNLHGPQFGLTTNFPISLPEDVAVVLKSGFGTKDRIPAWLGAHEGVGFGDVVLIADFATRLGEGFGFQEGNLSVGDMVMETRETGAFPIDYRHPRLGKYDELRDAISQGKLDVARDLSADFGWELDAMKFISGLATCYTKLPNKKWYLMVDDDTYLIPQTLELLLEHLDPSNPHYIGNAVGDYRARFAHGGSGVILSQAAVHRLFAHPEIVSAAHRESLGEVWGDRLLAMALARVGVYLDETYTSFFDGDRLWRAKVTEGRLCSPVVSFHRLSTPELMRAVDLVMRDVKPGIVRWADLWELVQAPAFDSPVWVAGREDLDHVGELDDVTVTVDDVRTAEECAQVCQRQRKDCLAWTWEPTTLACHFAPWMIPGVQAVGKVSGINAPVVQAIAERC